MMRLHGEGIPEIRNIDELNDAIGDVMNVMGVRQETAERVLYLACGIRALHPANDGDATLNQMINEAVEAHEPWATDWLRANLRRSAESYRPIYKRALRHDVDPIVALQVSHDMALEAARETSAILGGAQPTL